MNLVRRNNLSPAKSPLTSLFDDFFNTSIGDIVGADFTTNQPSVNVMEEADKYIIEVAAPGIKKTDFEVSIEKDQLIISAQHTLEDEEGEDRKFTRREYNFKSFRRSFHIPKSINREEVGASYDKGILSITLLKTEEAKDKAPTVIDIK